MINHAAEAELLLRDMNNLMQEGNIGEAGANVFIREATVHALLDIAAAIRGTNPPGTQLADHTTSDGDTS